MRAAPLIRIGGPSMLYPPGWVKERPRRVERSPRWGAIPIRGAIDSVTRMGRPRDRGAGYPQRIGPRGARTAGLPVSRRRGPMHEGRNRWRCRDSGAPSSGKP
jgi:hypothetical protein